MEEKLENIHQQINALLRFTKKKNAGLLAFNGIVILEGIKNIFQHQSSIDCWRLLIFGYILVLNVISFLICMSSIFPSRQSKIKKSKAKDLTNLLFYETISSLTVTEYFEQFQNKYKIKPKSKEFCFDLIRQLIIQSQILVSKFNKFKLASLFTFCAFTTPFGYIIYKRLFNTQNNN